MVMFEKKSAEFCSIHFSKCIAHQTKQNKAHNTECTLHSESSKVERIYTVYPILVVMQSQAIELLYGPLAVASTAAHAPADSMNSCAKCQMNISISIVYAVHIDFPVTIVQLNSCMQNQNTADY